jgi:hypothetical protein
MPVYVPKTKDQRAKLQSRVAAPLRTVTLRCGHVTDEAPTTSNPDRWFCCGQWRRAR